MDMGVFDVKLQLNNPLVLLSGKLLGVGIEVDYIRVGGKRRIDVEHEAVAWTRVWEWSW